MPKISLTLGEVKQIISEKYFKKHDVTPSDISIFNSGSIMIQTIDSCDSVTDEHYIFSFETDRTDI